MDTIKYQGLTIQGNRQVHKRVEETSAGRVEWVEMTLRGDF